jgi:uncharacterized integral membrane protein
MRWFHTAVIAVFVVAMLIFAIQNAHTVEIEFLGFVARMPMAILAIVIYLLGMVTGGSLRSLLRRAIEGSRRPENITPRA